MSVLRPDLMMKCFVAAIEERLLLIEDFRRAAVHGVDDVLEGVQALEWDPLQESAAETRRAEMRDVWHGPSEHRQRI